MAVRMDSTTPRKASDAEEEQASAAFRPVAGESITSNFDGAAYEVVGYCDTNTSTPRPAWFEGALHVKLCRSWKGRSMHFLRPIAELQWHELTERRGWREGFVDQSELHILVQWGGTEIQDNEPEGIKIALIGPDENQQLIVEFLPMIGVDPEAGQDARDAGIGLIERTVDRGRRLGNPWQYAKHHCGTGANMYSLVRFVPRSGRRP
jgi:hypothetical protein